jgi:hypothetical protein
MKITKNALKQIIKEELKKTLKETLYKKFLQEPQTLSAEELQQLYNQLSNEQRNAFENPNSYPGDPYSYDKDLEKIQKLLQSKNVALKENRSNASRNS